MTPPHVGYGLIHAWSGRGRSPASLLPPRDHTLSPTLAPLLPDVVSCKSSSPPLSPPSCRRRSQATILPRRPLRVPLPMSPSCWLTTPAWAPQRPPLLPRGAHRRRPSSVLLRPCSCLRELPRSPLVLHRLKFTAGNLSSELPPTSTSPPNTSSPPDPTGEPFSVWCPQNGFLSTRAWSPATPSPRVRTPLLINFVYSYERKITIVCYA
jgi:hypothetical protein